MVALPAGTWIGALNWGPSVKDLDLYDIESRCECGLGVGFSTICGQGNKGSVTHEFDANNYNSPEVMSYGNINNFQAGTHLVYVKNFANDPNLHLAQLSYNLYTDTVDILVNANADPGSVPISNMA